MGIKGLVYVPGDERPGWQGEAPGLQLVANRALVCHALDALTAPSIGAVAVLAAREQLPAIRAALAAEARPGPEPVYLPLGSRRDLTGALDAAAEFVDGDAAVLHLATGLLGQPLGPVLHGLQADAPDLLMLLHHGDGRRPALGPATERLLGVAEIGGEGSRLGLAEVAGVGPGAVARAAGAARDALPPRGGPANGASAPHPLLEIAERLAAADIAVAAGIVPSWCRYSCDPADLLELNRSVLDRQAPQTGPPAGTNNRIEGRVVIHPSAEVSASLLHGPCLIGAGAQVSDAYVGPYTTLGPRSVIEGSEIVRSVVAEGARIVYVGGRIEGSTIGRGSNIFRDFALPRAMRLHVGENVEVALD
jgi:glucose-1-phosphate thymidylyltransferase